MFTDYILPNFDQVIETGLAAVSLIISLRWVAILLSPFMMLVGSILMLAVEFSNHEKAPAKLLKTSIKRKSLGRVRKLAQVSHSICLFLFVKLRFLKIWLTGRIA